MRAAAAAVPDGPHVEAATLSALPDALRGAAAGVRRTGGLHAAALFTVGGRLRGCARTSGATTRWTRWSGRPGWRPAALDDQGPAGLGPRVVRIVQKALLAGIPLIAAVSAPSSLAVDWRATPA